MICFNEYHNEAPDLTNQKPSREAANRKDNLFPAFYETHSYEGRSESKERFAIQRYLLIIGKKQSMQVLSHTFTYFST